MYLLLVGLLVLGEVDLVFFGLSDNGNLLYMDFVYWGVLVGNDVDQLFVLNLFILFDFGGVDFVYYFQFVSWQLLEVWFG